VDPWITPVLKLQDMEEKWRLLPSGYLQLLQRKRYSENTIKIYTCYFLDFQSSMKGKDLRSLTKADINKYTLDLIRGKGISASQQNQRINASLWPYIQEDCAEAS
jgi:integrase/recombinase XerD